MKIPSADSAVIDPAKLRGYLLSLSHPIGRFKARFFERLGYAATQWEVLEADLRAQHLMAEAEPLAAGEFGQKYRIRAILEGPTGRADVVSVWVV